MIGMTNARGGKDRLKLRVFGGTTAPSNPKDNDIWVKTSIAIPKHSVYINKAISNFWTGAVNGGIYIKFEASGNNATTGAKKLVSDLFFNIDDVESTLRNQIDIAFSGTTSVSNSARVIVKNAYLLGCDITNNIMDEYGTNQELRRVAGLL